MVSLIPNSFELFVVLGERYITKHFFFNKVFPFSSIQKAFREEMISTAGSAARREACFAQQSMCFSVEDLQSKQQRIVGRYLLVGGIPTPLKNVKVNWDVEIPQYMGT